MSGNVLYCRVVEAAKTQFKALKPQVIKSATPNAKSGSNPAGGTNGIAGQRLIGVCSGDNS